MLLVLLLATIAIHRSDGFMSPSPRAFRHFPQHRSCITRLSMALTPTGPFCPFRSSAALEMDPRMESLNTKSAPEFATEMERIQLDMAVGTPPDPDRLRRVAAGMDQAVDDWENLLTRLRLSQDFQTREYAKLTQAHLETHGVTQDGIAKMMRWQSGCMKALADNMPPPMPPADLDLMAMMKQAESDKKSPSMTAMSAAEKITADPFTGEEGVFQSETVKEEYEKLCEDHSKLIEMGSSYASFDPSGKLAFLDQIEMIQDRWDVFFARFKLLGQLNEEFVKQCNDFLDSMGMDEEDYKKLLKKTHDIMRLDADKERNALPY